MAYNNDSKEYPQNPSIWGSTQELSDTPNTLIYGRGTPYVGIFDENGNPIIEPQSQNSLGELCTDFTYTSVEQGMDTADITIQCSNPNLLALPSLHYRSILILQWGYIPLYSGDSLYSSIKQMVILKRETVFNDNGVTVNLHLSDPNYFLYLMNPNYLGIPGVSPNDLAFAIGGLYNLGLPYRLTAYTYQDKGNSREQIVILPRTDGFHRQTTEKQPIKDISNEVEGRHGVYTGDTRRVRASGEYVDENGNPLTTTYEYIALFNKDELSKADNIINNTRGYSDEEIQNANKLLEQYNSLKALAEKNGWAERVVVDPLVDMTVSYIGGTKNDANILNQIAKGFNHVFGSPAIIRGNGSGELLIQTEIRTNIPYRTYTWAGGNGELLEFSASDDFSVNNIYGNESKDIDTNKQYNTNKAIDADSDPKKNKYITVWNQDLDYSYDLTNTTVIGSNLRGYGQSLYTNDPYISVDRFNNKSWLPSDVSQKDRNQSAGTSSINDVISQFMAEAQRRNIPVYTEATLPDRQGSLSDQALVNEIFTEYPLTSEEIKRSIVQMIEARKRLEKVNDIEQNVSNYTDLMQIVISRKVRIIVEGDVSSRSYNFFEALNGAFEKNADKDKAVDNKTKYYETSLIPGSNFAYRIDGITDLGEMVNTYVDNDGNTKKDTVKLYEISILYSIPNDKCLDCITPNMVNTMVFSNNLYQVTSHKIEAKARLLGNPELEATLNVNIQGVGEYSMRWFVTKVVHQINQESGYICDVEFRPYDQSSKQLLLSASEATSNVFKVVETVRDKMKSRNTIPERFTMADYYDCVSKEMGATRGAFIDPFNNTTREVSMTEGYEFLDSMNDNITNQSTTNAQNLQQDN